VGAVFVDAGVAARAVSDALAGTGIAFVFNAPRFIAFLGPLFAGTLIVQFGGYGKAAMIFACIYFLAFVAAPFLPATKGKPLPEAVWIRRDRWRAISEHGIKSKPLSGHWPRASA